MAELEWAQPVSDASMTQRKKHTQQQTNKRFRARRPMPPEGTGSERIEGRPMPGETPRDGDGPHVPPADEPTWTPCAKKEGRLGPKI